MKKILIGVIAFILGCLFTITLFYDGRGTNPFISWDYRLNSSSWNEETQTLTWENCLYYHTDRIVNGMSSSSIGNKIFCIKKQAK